MGFEILHAWKSVSGSRPTVEMHFDMIDPWSSSGREWRFETAGEPIAARTSAADCFVVSEG